MIFYGPDPIERPCRVFVEDGKCWHARHDLACPVDPWPETPEPAPAAEPCFTDPPF